MKEIELEQRVKLWNSLFSGAGIGIAIVEKSGFVIKANPKLCKFLGYTEEELKALSFSDFTYPEDLEKDVNLFNQTINGEIDSYEIEKRYIKKNGEVIWGLLTVSVVKDENNNFQFAVGMIQDITKRHLTENKLRESERRFKAIFNSTYQFIGLLSPDGIIIEANKSALNFAGVTQGDVIGKPFWETPWWNTTNCDKSKLKESIKKAASGVFSRFEAEHRGVNNAIITVDFSLTPIKDESGKVILVVPEGRDITENIKSVKMLAESENRFRAFVHQAPTAIAIFNKNMNYIVASKKWSEDYNITFDLEGKNHYDIFPEINEERKQLHREAMNGRIIRRMRDSYIKKDGTVSWLKWEFKPWYNVDGQIGGLMIYSDDITEDVKNEKVILNLNRDLQELNQHKIRLLSVIAHDIKGPVANCLGLLNLVHESQESMSKDVLLEYIRMIDISIKNASQLIEELLLWSKSQFHSLSFEPDKVNLFKTVEKIINQLRLIAESKSIKIINQVDKQTELKADKNMLNTIIRNLISNAIKFTPMEGIIHIRNYVKDGFSEISVIDSGIGIKQEDIEKIFNPASNFTTYGTIGEKGTGLGLKLCQTFVEKHGGKLSVKSQPGAGSTFYFTIPIAT